MNRDDVSFLFDYHYWATARVLDQADRVSPEQFSRHRPAAW
jgi:hypothetical protein